MNNSINTLKQEIKALADNEIASHSQRFFKTGKGQYGEGDIFLGIRVPNIRQLAKKYHQLSLSDINTILQSKYHEERLLAAIMLVNQFKISDSNTQESIYALYRQNTHKINNWDIVDMSAPDIVGGYLWDKDRAPLYKLAKSKLLWDKRISMMATLYFIKRHDFTDALNIAAILLTDDHDLIHKASGWMLREIGKQDQKIEEAFLNTHYKNMPRTMLRYAIEKFPETLRQKYLKGEIDVESPNRLSQT